MLKAKLCSVIGFTSNYQTKDLTILYKICLDTDIRYDTVRMAHVSHTHYNDRLNIRVLLKDNFRVLAFEYIIKFDHGLK